MTRVKKKRRERRAKRRPAELKAGWLVKHLLNDTLDHYGNELSESRGRFRSFSFERLFDRVELPEDKLAKLRYFAERGRLIYALPFRSQLDFLFLNSRLRESDLPMPEIAYNMTCYRFQPIRKILKVLLARLIHLVNYKNWPNPFENKYYLKRYREGAGFALSLEDPASFIKRLVYPIHDPLYHLLKLHRKRKETIIIIPVFPVFERGPHRQEKRFWDFLFGPSERPGRLRKIVHYLRYSGSAFLEVGDPVTIDRFLARPDQQGLTDEELTFNLRKELWEHATREQRAIRGPRLKPRTQIMETVLRDPETLRVMRQDSKRRGKSFRAVRKEAAKYADEIAANYSQTMIEFLDLVLSWAWTNLYDGVEVDQEGLNKVREAAKRHPVVYVPCHKSHIDYLILSWALYHNHMAPPHIAAGVNLNTWPIGTVFRKSGAFFLRRSFRDNPLYGVVFAKYIEVLIREGYNLEFFIEGGRSRTGRLLLPKLGMVKYVLDAFQKEAARDIIFAPVYIGYDQIIEENEYLDEMTGTKKAGGNLAELLHNRNLIRKRYGHIYLNFGSPISLREHVEGMSDLAGEDQEAHDKAVVESLAERVIKSINLNQVVTPFSLLAAALLTSPHKAISHSALVNALALYYQRLLEVNAKFADTLADFDKASEEVIAYYQRRKLIEVEDGEDQEEPIYTLPEDHRLSLEMYKNMVLHHFYPISFTALSLLSADYGECLESKLREDYHMLKDLFAYDFIYDDRLSDPEQIENCLRFLINGRHLEVSGKNGMRKFTVTAKGREELVYFAALLTNFLEAYGIVLNSLPRLLARPLPEKEVLQNLSRAGQRLYKQGQVLRPEALSQLLYKNALQFARAKGLVKTEDSEKGKPAALIAAADQEDARNQLLTHISKFIRVEKYHYLDH